MLTSLPIEHPQPNQEFYGLDVLNLFQTCTRAQYEAAGGPLVPFDPTRPEQDWWDDSATADPMTYNVVVGANGFQSISQIRLPLAQAKAPNFKGRPAYPKYSVAQTEAVFPHAAPSNPSLVDPYTLSTQDQANAMLTELGGMSVVDQGGPNSEVILPGIGEIIWPVSYPADDPRRLFAVILNNGKQANVGTALKEKYVNGVGAPGQWVADATQTSGLSWRATELADGSASAAPALPVPCRPLRANERLMTSLVGGLGFQSTQVQRTDLIPAPVFAGATDPVLLDVQAKVTALYNLIVARS